MSTDKGQGSYLDHSSPQQIASAALQLKDGQDRAKADHRLSVRGQFNAALARINKIASEAYQGSTGQMFTRYTQAYNELERLAGYCTAFGDKPRIPARLPPPTVNTDTVEITAPVAASTSYKETRGLDKNGKGLPLAFVLAQQGNAVGAIAAGGTK